ncbi:hypothetical protein KI387_000828, partial [Taxus chinensis]
MAAGRKEKWRRERGGGRAETGQTLKNTAPTTVLGPPKETSNPATQTARATHEHAGGGEPDARSRGRTKQ